MRDFCIQLGERLVGSGYKIISGMGLNIGDSVVKGALMKLYEMGVSATERHLTVRPFPRTLPAGSEPTFNRQYRTAMIEQCGFALFIAGTSRSHAESAGVMDEFDIATRLGKVPIPIGATGYAARRIWEAVNARRADIYHDAVDARLFAVLNDPNRSNAELLQATFTVIDSVARDDRM